MKIVRYDSAMRSRILELHLQGYSLVEMSRLIGIHRNTLTRWIAKHNLREEMDAVKAENIKAALELGLSKLAAGAKTTEEIRERIEDDGEGNITKVTEKVRVLAPSEKAIQILAQKYDKILSNGNVTDANGNAASPLININYSGMTLRELNSIDSPLGRLEVVDAEYTETQSSEEDSDSERKDSDSEFRPPVKDLK